MTGELDGKIALITGAAQGIGEAAARRMAELGAKVVLGDILDEKAAALAQTIGEAAIAVHLDVSKEADWGGALQAAKAHFGRVDILVNNAGVMETTAVLDTSDAQFDRMMNINLRGTFLGIRTIGREMAESGGGAIVNLGSVVSTTPVETLGLYAATKGGVASLTRVAAMELGPKGIRVCLVRPGSIATPMAGPEVEKGLFPRVLAAGRIGRPEDVAEAIAFAASDRAAYITGSEIIVDGGWSAGRYGLEVVGAEAYLKSLADQG